MAKISKEIKVGLIVTSAVAAAIWGINYLKGQDIFSLTNEYYVTYPQVNGLAKSNQVKLNGFKVGQVEKISFTPDHSGKIEVEINVSSKIFISKDATALIASADLLGTKEIQIVLGESPDAAKDGAHLRGDIQLGLTETIGNQMGPVKDKVEHLLQSIDTLARNLNSAFTVQNKRNMDEGLASLSSTMYHLNHISEMLDSDSGLRGTLNNVQSFSKNLKDNNAKIDNLVGKLSDVSDSLAASNLKSAIDNLNKSMAEFSGILARINKGEGSLGALINDNKLYMNLNNSAANLDSLMYDIKANPKRYVHFSLFGKKGR